MKNPKDWQPSKIVFNHKRKAYEANPAYVSLGSLFAVDQMAGPFERLIQTHTRGRLLDCGCGDVPYYAIYRDRVSEAICVDWGASAHGKSHVDQEVNLNEALPFEAERFDTVLLADVLEHIAEPARLMTEIARVLSPAGKVLVMVPFLYWVHEAPHDYYRYTEFAIREFCRQAGLELVQMDPYGGYPDVLMDLANKGLSASAPICRAFLVGARWISKRRFYERWRGRTKHAFPLGYCFVGMKSAC